MLFLRVVGWLFVGIIFVSLLYTSHLGSSTYTNMKIKAFQSLEENSPLSKKLNQITNQYGRKLIVMQIVKLLTMFILLYFLCFV